MSRNNPSCSSFTLILFDLSTNCRRKVVGCVGRVRRRKVVGCVGRVCRRKVVGV